MLKEILVYNHYRSLKKENTLKLMKKMNSMFSNYLWLKYNFNAKSVIDKNNLSKITFKILLNSIKNMFGWYSNANRESRFHLPAGNVRSNVMLDIIILKYILGRRSPFFLLSTPLRIMIATNECRYPEKVRPCGEISVKSNLIIGDHDQEWGVLHFLPLKLSTHWR